MLYQILFSGEGRKCESAEEEFGEMSVDTIINGKVRSEEIFSKHFVVYYQWLFNFTLKELTKDFSIS